MQLRKFTAVVAAGLIALSAAAFAQDDVVLPATNSAIAAMTPEQMVTARKALMKEDGGLLRSASTLTGDAAVAAAQTLVTNFTNFPHLFPEGSMVGDTDALPAIWENWDAFVGIFAAARKTSEVALAAAQAGDSAAYVAALQPLGPMCGQCHQQFRAD